jgi:hypothetical protein
MPRVSTRRETGQGLHAQLPGGLHHTIFFPQSVQTNSPFLSAKLTPRTVLWNTGASLLPHISQFALPVVRDIFSPETPNVTNDIQPHNNDPGHDGHV